MTEKPRHCYLFRYDSKHEFIVQYKKYTKNTTKYKLKKQLHG